MTPTGDSDHQGHFFYLEEFPSKIALSLYDCVCEGGWCREVTKEEKDRMIKKGQARWVGGGM